MRYLGCCWAVTALLLYCIIYLSTRLFTDCYLSHLIFNLTYSLLSRYSARTYSKGGPVGNQGNFTLVTFSFFLLCSTSPSFSPSPSMSYRCFARIHVLVHSSYLPSLLTNSPNTYLLTNFLPYVLPSLLGNRFLTFGLHILISLPYRDTHFKDSSGVKVQADALEALRLVLVGKVDEVSPCSSHINCHISVLPSLSSSFFDK
jgi:hypothetical protein